MSKRRITALKDVKTLEVSLVESGANQKKRFPIMKKSRSDQMDEILVEVLKAEGQSEAVEKLESILKMDMPADAKNAVMAAMKLLEAYSDMMPVGEALAALRSASGEKAEADKADEEKIEKPEGRPQDYMKADEDDEDKTKKMKEEEELKKSLGDLPESAQKAMQAIWKRSEELAKKLDDREKELGVEIAKRARREYLAKAEKTLCNIPGHSLDEVVDLMIDVKARDADLGDRVEKALEAASAAMQGGPLLVEAGRNVPDMSAGDPWSKIQQIAKSEVQKANGSLSMPQAIAKTIQTNPALYEAYNAERERKNVGGR
jgi:hypothetical protein|tara:strand:- start:1367 stop:2317 length:951 start_codon:yes stop_codon:yes gene_type:complete